MSVAYRWGAAAFVVALLLKSRLALADDNSVEEASRWYRGALAGAYAVPIGGGALVVGGLATRAPIVAFAGLVPLAYGGIVPPIVHWAHGNVWRGFLSLGGQSLGASLGLVTALAVARCDSALSASALSADLFPADCFVTAWGAGVALGTAAWAAIDIGFLAYEDEPVRETAKFRLSPIVAPLDHGAFLGVAASVP